jgi:hypothetical protein
MQGLLLRQQSGTDDVDIPGIPQSLVGISLAPMPRDLRAAFLHGVPNTVDLDMCASDQQCISERYPDLEHIERYGHDTANFRKELAAEAGTTVAEIKQAVVTVGYDGKSRIPVGPKLQAL